MNAATRALRLGVALSRLDHIVPLGLYGPDALDLVDRLVPRALYLRDGMMAPTLLLDADGRILADVTAVADDADFVLLVEGLAPEALLAHVAAQLRPGEEVELRPMWERYRLLGVTGPYAWELMEKYAGAEILGLPYLSAVALDEEICLRAGKTGEWGYQLLVPNGLVEDRWQKLRALGAVFDAEEVGLAELDAVALENAAFVIRVPTLAALTAPEAQLQWCLSPGKTGYLGAEAVAVQLATPPKRRLTYAVAEGVVEVGAPVCSGDTTVGTVVHALPSPSRGGVLVLALLELAHAHPGQALEVSGVAITTVSAPAVANLSLALDPQQHHYVNRDRDFPGWTP